MVLVSGGSVIAQKYACLLRAGDGGKARAAGGEGYPSNIGKLAQFWRAARSVYCLRVMACSDGGALRMALARRVSICFGLRRRDGGGVVTSWFPAGRKV